MVLKKNHNQGMMTRYTSFFSLIYLIGSSTLVLAEENATPSASPVHDAVAASSEARYSDHVFAAKRLKQNHWSLSLSSLGFGLGSSQGAFVLGKPRIEYFVSDMLALGFELPFSASLSGRSPSSLGLAITTTAYVLGWENFNFYIGGAYAFNSLSLAPANIASQDFRLTWGGNFVPVEWFGIGPRLELNFPTFGTEGRKVSLNLEFINLFFYL